MVVYNGVWWYMVVYGGIWWYMMVYGCTGQARGPIDVTLNPYGCLRPKTKSVGVGVYGGIYIYIHIYMLFLVAHGGGGIWW